MTLQRIQVSGSGMPTTEMTGRWSELPGGCSAPGCEQNRRRSLSAANAANLRLGSADKGRRVAVDRCRRPALVQPLFPARIPAAHAASSRRAVRLEIRCITAGKTQRFGLREDLGPERLQLPFTPASERKLMQFTPCCTHNALGGRDARTHGCCFQVSL